MLEIKMPAMPATKTATVAKISVAVGDCVSEGQELFSLETKKGARPVKAAADGIISELKVSEGEEVAVGQVLALMEEEASKPEVKQTAEPVVSEVKMPAMPGTKTATVGKISVSVGDRVSEGQELFSLETKKGARPVKAASDGVISELKVSEGEEVAVGQVLALLQESGTAETAPTEAKPAQKNIVEKHTELLILGGGTGGYVAAIAAAKQGKKVTLVEQDRLGGTCLNRGCIPTKTLIASATLCNKLREADVFGIELEGSFCPQMERIIERKNQVVDRLVGGIGYLMDKNSIEVIEGTAGFVDNKTVRVDSDATYLYQFDDCIIATGSVTSNPPLPNMDLPQVMDSTAALNCTELPQSVTVIGSGVIGMEFAFLYRNLGAQVTVIVSRDRPLPMIDRDLSESILEIARDMGIRMEMNSRVSGFLEDVNGQVITTFTRDGKEHFSVSDKALLAVGRRPNLEGLGLENTDVKLNEKGKGIAVDDHMRTSVEHIYAVGDVNNLIQLAHAASHQGMIAVDNILGKDHAFHKSEVPSVIFTHPEIATVGIGEDEAKRKGIAYKVGRVHYTGNGKALTMNETEGFVKLLKDENDVIIGGAVIGADASTLIASIGLAIANKLTDADIEKTIFAHPTTAEVIHEAALDLSLGAFHE